MTKDRQAGVLARDQTAALSWASSPATRRVMQGNKKRDTRPEMAVRRAVHALGLRYRVACRPLRDRRWTADMVFARARVAVFIDGCFWHGCPEHFNAPRTNRPYWASKIERNRTRDALVDATLEQEGWRVLRFWEHQPADSVADKIATAVRGGEVCPE